METEILPGDQPYWPPVFGLSRCSSCDSVEEECVLGCQLAFNSSLNPVPPSPTPPPPAPLPPAPWPNTKDEFDFSVVLSSHMVLQAAPAAAAVFGVTGAPGNDAVVAVTVAPSSGAPYTLPAVTSSGRWKALLRPTGADPSLTYVITATCASGCGSAAPNASVSLTDVVFGDVYYWCVPRTQCSQVCCRCLLRCQPPQPFAFPSFLSVLANRICNCSCDIRLRATHPSRASPPANSIMSGLCPVTRSRRGSHLTTHQRTRGVRCARRRLYRLIISTHSTSFRDVLSLRGGIDRRIQCVWSPQADDRPYVARYRGQHDRGVGDE